MANCGATEERPLLGLGVEAPSNADVVGDRKSPEPPKNYAEAGSNIHAKAIIGKHGLSSCLVLSFV